MNNFRSMTGYGRGRCDSPGGGKITVEIKGVNNRALDVIPRLPKGWIALEPFIRDEVKRGVHRGRVEVYVVAEVLAMNVGGPVIAEKLAQEYVNVGEKLSEELGVANNLNLYELFRLPNVLSLSEDMPEPEELWASVEPAMQQAMGEFLVAKRREGAALAQDILKRLRTLEGLMDEVEQLRPNAVKVAVEKLQARIDTLMENREVDETRIAQEAAILADKQDISEEVVRLRSHIEQFSQTLSCAPPLGRELDFLLQEMFRETNTSCAKSFDVGIVRLLLKAKNEIEKIREQVQNIE